MEQDYTKCFVCCRTYIIGGACACEVCKERKLFKTNLFSVGFEKEVESNIKKELKAQASGEDQWSPIVNVATSQKGKQ